MPTQTENEAEVRKMLFKHRMLASPSERELQEGIDQALAFAPITKKGKWKQPANVCDVGGCKEPAAYTRFHPDYPTHSYTLCEGHDCDEAVEKLVEEYRKKK